MTFTRTCLALALLAAALTACSNSDAPAGPVSAAQAETKASTATTGIAACDSFLDAYEQCVKEKMPESVRGQMQTGLDQWRQSWRDMANNAASRDALPQVCQQARDSTASAMQAYGCTF